MSRTTPLDATRLWTGGVATALVAALIALVGVLVVRAVFELALHAPAAAGPFGGPGTAVLCVLAAVAALAATAVAPATSLLHLVIGLAIGSLVSGAAARTTGDLRAR